MSVAFISHSECRLHGIGIEHPESPQRLFAIQDALIENQLESVLTYYDAPLAKRENLTAAHAQKYLDTIFSVAPARGVVWLDPDTFMTAGSLDAALRATGANILAVDLLMGRKATRVFSAVRPPGHHAEHDRAMGFCIFNNVAVGAMYAREKYGIERVAIIDFDVHHGNGTENIVQNDSGILLCSLFQHPYYPFSGADTRSNHIVNVPLPAGTEGPQYRELFTTKCLAAIEQFEPQLVLVSAGFDAHTEEQLADLRLEDADYVWLTHEIKTLADRFCEGKVAFTLEGGYHLPALARSVCAVIDELIN